MSWFFAVLVVLLIGAVAVVASGRGGSLGTAYDDRADVRLPADRPVTGDDLRGLRLNTAVRGYNASEVDALLELLADQLDRDAGDGARRGDTRGGTRDRTREADRAAVEPGDDATQDPGPTA